MEDELRREAEKYLGFTICPQEWDRAKHYAEHKLTCIIQREGDAGGERRKPYYLAQLIAETVRADTFSGILFELAELQWEQKKDSSCISTEPSSTCPYCSINRYTLSSTQ